MAVKLSNFYLSWCHCEGEPQVFAAHPRNNSCNFASLNGSGGNGNGGHSLFKPEGKLLRQIKRIL